MCAKQKTHRVCNALIENVFPSRKGIFGQKNGAVDEARTRDLHLGKVALYQLSYYRISATARRSKMVRAKRLELLRRRHWNLTPARLPIPPRPHYPTKHSRNHALRQSTKDIISHRECFVKPFFHFLFNSTCFLLKSQKTLAKIEKMRYNGKVCTLFCNNCTHNE